MAVYAPYMPLVVTTALPTGANPRKHGTLCQKCIDKHFPNSVKLSQDETIPSYQYN